MTILTAEALSFGISLSQHACGNLLRYAVKAPPEPETLESTTGAGALDLAPGLDVIRQPQGFSPAAVSLPEPRLYGTTSWPGYPRGGAP